MAELSSGPEPSTADPAWAALAEARSAAIYSAPPASQSSSPPQRLPQAQAENILASLAGRSTSPGGPAENKLPLAKPVGTHLARPARTAPTAETGAGHEPSHSPGGSKPGWPAGNVTFKSQAAPGTVAKRAQVADATAGPAVPAEGALPGPHAGGQARRASQHKDTPPSAGPYGNDILPAKPKGRFRFRLR
jgi:hypothetical protein